MSAPPFNRIESGQWYAIGGQFKLAPNGDVHTHNLILAPMGPQRHG